MGGALCRLCRATRRHKRLWQIACDVALGPVHRQGTVCRGVVFFTPDAHLTFLIAGAVFRHWETV